MDNISFITNYNVKFAGRDLIPLYPHGFENYVIVMPNRLKQSSNLLNVIRSSSLIIVWLPVILVMGYTRKFIRKFAINSNNENFMFDTVRITLTGASNITLLNRSEQLLVLFMSIFFLLAGIFCCGDIFKEIATSKYTPSINSLESLNESNLLVHGSKVLVEKYSTQWLYLKYILKKKTTVQIHSNFVGFAFSLKLRNQFIVAHYEYIYSNITAKLNTQAYIIPQSKVDVLIDRNEMQVDGRPIFNVIKIDLGTLNFFVFVIIIILKL